MASLSLKEIRYDRQLRLWGDHGQRALENARVCLLNASTTGAEVLKSLILPGIGFFTIIDHRKITQTDIDNNFFVDIDQLGCGRAETVCRFLKELNSDVKGDFFDENVDLWNENNLEILDSYTVVIGSDLSAKTAVNIGDYLWKRQIPFIVCKSYGLIGYIRICAPELHVIESHPDNLPPDFRLDNPFSELKSYSDSFDLDSLDHAKHSHVPYLVLLLKALAKWRMSKQDETAFPSNYKEKMEIKQILLSMRKSDEKGNLDEENFHEAVNSVIRTVTPTTVPQSCKNIFAHPSCVNLTKNSDKFWIITNALKTYVEQAEDGRKNFLPLRGDLPDMIADSETYVKLQNIFYEKAERDARIVHKIVEQKLADLGIPSTCISFEETRLYCKNVAFMRVIDGRPLRHEYGEELKSLRKIQDNEDPILTPLLNWYVVLRATESFFAQKARYPGTNGIPIELDKNDLKSRVIDFTKQHNLKQLVVDNEVEEMCRYGAAEIHGVVSFVGGLVAHEVIKLITNQYVPLNNTLIYDGNTGNAGVFEL